MTLQALPRRVASLSPSTPACATGRLPTASSRLWPNLSAETQTQLAQLLAQLMRRMQPADDATRRGSAHADDIERR